MIDSRNHFKRLQMPTYKTHLEAANSIAYWTVRTEHPTLPEMTNEDFMQRIWGTWSQPTALSALIVLSFTSPINQHGNDTWNTCLKALRLAA